MRKILLLIFTILVVSTLTLSQSNLAELEKIKKIKIFGSSQKDVQKLLPKYFDEDSLETGSYMIRADIGYLNVTFSEGNCGEDEYWNVARGLVTGVSISNLGELEIKDLGFDLKNFKKEIEDKDHPEDIDYHDEKSGIFIRTEDGEVEDIVFYPPKSKKGLLCKNENTAEIISGKERLVDTVPTIACILKNTPAVINDVILSETEVFANEKTKILVRVSASDLENDVLTYNYEVSGGKIEGRGAIVEWDLSSVKPGKYRITAWIDDGMGKTNTITKTVAVKENADISKK